MPSLNWIGKEAGINRHQKFPFENNEQQQGNRAKRASQDHLAHCQRFARQCGRVGLQERQAGLRSQIDCIVAELEGAQA